VIGFFLKWKHVVADLRAGGKKMIQFSTFYKYVRSLNVLIITISSYPGGRIKPKIFLSVF